MAEKPISGTEIMKQTYPEPEWMVPGFVLERGITALYAPPGQKKSWLALQLCRSLVGGHSFLGMTPRKSGLKALYFGLEDTEVRVQRRMNSQGWTSKEVGKIFFKFEMEPVLDGGFAQINEAIGEVQPNFVVIDPVFMIVGRKVDINSAAQMGDVMKQFKTIVREYRIGLHLVHHTRKTSKQNPAGNLDESASGSMAFAALTDIRMQIYHPPTSRDALILIAGKDRDYSEIKARFDPNDCMWKLVEEMADDGSLRSQVIEYLSVRKGAATSATDMADGLRKDRSNVVKELIRLENEGMATSRKAGRERLYTLRKYSILKPSKPEGPA